MNQKIENQNKEIAALKQARAAESAAFETRILAVQKSIDEKPAISPELEKQLSDLKEQIGKAPGFKTAEEFEAFKQSVAGLRSDLDKAPKSETLTALSDSLTELEGKLVSATDFKDIKDYVAKVKTGLDTLLAAADPEVLKTLKETLASLRNDLSSKTALTSEDILKFTDRIATLEKLIDTKVDIPGVAVAKAAAARLLPKHFAQFSFVEVPKTAAKQDRYKVYGRAGAITVEGSSPAVMLTGLTAYLKQVAGVSIGWPGDSLDLLPQTLPGPTAPIETAANGQHRFALNDTDDGYSDAYKSWPEWERKIDLLAMHGINEVFIPVGVEEVYRQTFLGFGYTDEEIRAWIPAPAHQPWWLMQNLSGLNAPFSPDIYRKRVEMGRRIINRLRELGMVPVMPGYFGTVPTNFAAKNPTARLVPQGEWFGTHLTRPDWLDPRTDLFAQIASAFYGKQRELFGDTTMYKMDILHEGGSAGDIPVQAAALAVGNALRDAHPGAIWVMLGWQENPKQVVVGSQKVEEVLVVDGTAGVEDFKNREADWLSRPYAFGEIHTYGGNTTLGAPTGNWIKRYYENLNKTGSAENGIAYLPEATGTNPAAFELFTDMVWQTKPIDQKEWFSRYASHRYGRHDEHADNAWNIMRQTAYTFDLGAVGPSLFAPHDSLFAAQPELTRTSAFAFGQGVHYNMEKFAKALPELLQVASDIRGTTAYRYDLVNLTRQVLVDRARTLRPKIKNAYDAKDKAQFAALTAIWLDYMRDLDALVATDPNFLLGRFLAGAKAYASSDTERTLLEYDQRSLISTWVTKASDDFALMDYANRDLSGLVSGLYMPRWKAYFESLTKALETGGAPIKIDWFDWSDKWARTRVDLPTEPSGDFYALATKIQEKISKEPSFPPVKPSTTDAKPTCVPTAKKSCPA
ncbi:alpha-N-acetylglucosaminidase [Phyllobacterium zundukense]|uniref:Alpha-N-acetylglucosaminidase C-terminal domain-containing protein n=1 Tax=Phyllobacterium zundukense TaxID=1867719 RepID=A0ACD4D3T8_9HYPH|nr:alpha-N-acetylglucosaminidase TIM-barrel domain-containing protein [Phyllobacterium zundukense]UXN60533.1 alpha-N-acetylglucosaminidase C-terminal domain-containing protein [Phyllobacterium zundukense]